MLIQKSLERVRENKLANDMYSLLVRLGMERFLIKIVYKWYELKPTYKMQQSSMYFNKHKEEIRELGKLLADQQSKNVWLKMIKLRMTMDYRYHPSKDRPQYFAKDLIQYDKNEVFIDCGAYDGKTSAEFMKYALNSGGGYKRVVIFEPDDLNMKKVKRNIKKSRDVVFIQKGVWNKTMKLPFHSAGNEASKVVEQAGSMEEQPGVKIVSVAAMDDMRECQDATFIKMDLEGAEMQALQGAENLIKRNKPKLAVCIYHSDQDMLEIIRYIHKIVPEYSLYVRQHSNGIGETVLYAVYKRT